LCFNFSYGEKSQNRIHRNRICAHGAESLRFNQLLARKSFPIASGRRENAENRRAISTFRILQTDWRETAERDDVDLICITTPPIFHREMTLFALEHD
jgi:predicted dehydrogenase